MVAGARVRSGQVVRSTGVMELRVGRVAFEAVPALSRSLSPGARTRSPWVLVLGILVALTAAACRSDVDVHVAVDPDGSGKVTVTADLDADAAHSWATLRLVLTDLTDAGWDVDGPTAWKGGLRSSPCDASRRRRSSPRSSTRVGGAKGVLRHLARPRQRPPPSDSTGSGPGST